MNSELKSYPLVPIRTNSSVNSDESEVSTVIVTSGKKPLNGKTLRGYGSWEPEANNSTIVWRDVSVYAVQGKSEYKNNSSGLKRIINNVSGVVQSGELVALMGASGAGKSTLMSALAYRNCPSTIVQGDILVNGRQVSTFMHRLSGFVHQEDLFVGTLTVREHLKFMANLKLDRRTTLREKEKTISDLLERSGLTSSANTRIGCEGDKKVLSGGEKKRLAFATELLTSPSILFCDEPTTGLDSYSAQQLVETLQLLAQRGTAIICTIHQPSSQLFAMFHKVLLLADGRVAFMGSPDRALEFFSNNGFICPRSYNPADFLIGILATTPGYERESQRIATRLCDLYAVSEEAQQRDILTQLQMHIGENGEFENAKKNCKKFIKPVWYKTVLWLFERKLLTVVRDPTIQVLRTVQKIGIALMAGLCFYGSINLTQSGVQSVQGALFIAVSENTFTPMYSVLSYFPQEFPLFVRERRSGIYSTSQYYLANIFAMLPGLIFEPVLFVIIGYMLAGLRPTLYALSMTTLLATLVMNVSTACGCFFSTTFKTVPVAMAYLVPFDYILLITSGVFVKLSSLPDYLSWMQYFSWLMYANEGMSIVQWEGVTNITCPENDTSLPCLHDGQEVMEQYSFSFDNLTRDISALCLLYVVFHVLGYLFLWKSVRNR